MGLCIASQAHRIEATRREGRIPDGERICYREAVSTASASHVGSLRFEFVAAKRPLIQGTIGALVFGAIVLAWAWLSGRIQSFEPMTAGMMAASVAVALPVVLGGGWRRAREAARMLGHLEVDGAGVRWHRPGAALGFDVSWSAVERSH